MVCVKCGGGYIPVDDLRLCANCTADAASEAREGLHAMAIYLLHHAEFAEWLETHGR